MKFTNKYHLPEPFVIAFGQDDYVRGDAAHTATELIKPVRIRAYTEKYSGQMVEDISDRVWRFFGSVKHLLLQQIAAQDPERYIAEQRFDTVMPGTSIRVSGQIDLYDTKERILYDYKETSTWKFMLGDTREWEEQANINLYLLRMDDIFPKKLINVAWLKDWKARKARMTRDGRYPECAIHVMPLPLWTVGQQQDFILKRAAAWEADHDNPPVCTKRERWERDATIALMKRGRKSAVRLFFNRDQAEAALIGTRKGSKPGEQFYLEDRPAEPVRCLDFCPVQQFCDFGREAVKKWRDG